jgi:hypothetical protein
MANIRLSAELYARIGAFKEVVEAVLGQSMTMQEHIEHLLHQALDRLLADAIASSDSDALLKTIQALSLRHPSEVYGFVANVWKTINDEQKREAIRGRFGFNQP